MNKIGLSVLVDTLEKFEVAINTGSDEVYMYLDTLDIDSLESNIDKLKLEELIKLAHTKGKKVYVGVNNIPHSESEDIIKSNLYKINELGFDAIYITDPGTLKIIKDALPEFNIFLNYHANVTNYMSAKFWHMQGIKRVTITRELNTDEITMMREKTPMDLQIEAFVHGGVNISYSGRKLISNYVKDKADDKYNTMHKYKLEEEKRPGEFFPIYENENGTYLFNSSDLCMIQYISDLAKSGVDIFTIDTRLKSSEYVSVVTNAYRYELDRFIKNPVEWKVEENTLNNLIDFEDTKLDTGFYLQNN